MHFAARPGISDLSVLIALLLGSITLIHTFSALADPMSRPADAQFVGRWLNLGRTFLSHPNLRFKSPGQRSTDGE